MVRNTEYSAFLAFLELIERRIAARRTESITFYAASGDEVGRFTLDGDAIRFGVELHGRIFVDEIFTREHPRHAESLKKTIEQKTLTRGEKELLTNISPQEHLAYCGLTARTIRKIARFLKSSSVELRMGETGRPRPRLLELSFPMVELALAAGRRGPIRYDDLAVKLYGSPPEHAEERWLLERQAEDLDSPWPVMTTRQGERRIATIGSFGALSQLLVSYLGTQSRIGALTVPSAQVVRFAESLCYIVSTERYVTLLIYHFTQTGRIVRALEHFIQESALPENVTLDGPAPSSSSAPAPGRTTKRWPPTEAAARTPPREDVLAEAAGSALPDKDAWDAAAAQLTPEAASEPLPIGVSQPAESPSLALAPAPAAIPAVASAVEAAPGRTDLAAAEPIAPSAQLAQEPLSEAIQSSPESSVLESVADFVRTEPPPAAEAELSPVAEDDLPLTPTAESPPTLEVSSPATPAAVLSPAAELALALTPDADLTPVHPGTAAAAPFPTFADPVLTLRGFTARLEDRTILKDLWFSIGQRGVYTLMGPGGSGKSSLNGILSGRNRTATGWTLTGEILFAGLPLGAAVRPAVVGQRIAPAALNLRTYLLADLDDGVAELLSEAQLRELLDHVRLPQLGGSLAAVLGSAALKPSLSQWWRLAIARELTTEPRLLCVDEPTAAMSAEDAAPILALLRDEAKKRAVLLVTHNQQQARDHSDYVILLAGGRVQEYRPNAEFFSRPQSRAAKDYVRTGGCYVPSPDARPDSLAEEFTTADPATGPAAELTPPEKPVQSLAAPQSEAAAAARLTAEPAAPPEPEPPASATVVAAPAGAPPVLWSARPAGNQAVLVLRRFELRVGGRILLSNLNLDLAAPGAYVLIAPDSAEKRLFVRALCGPRPANMQLGGQALYLGRELAETQGPATPQSGAQLMMMTVGGYLASNLPRRSSLSRLEQRAQAAALVEKCGFPELVSRLDVEMTGIEVYERRTLELVRAAAALPPLLVLDEPLAGLGKAEQPVLLRLLKLQAGERALLILARDHEPLAELGAAVAWMTDGRLTEVPPAVPRAMPAPSADPAPGLRSPSPSAPPSAEQSAETPASETVGSFSPRQRTGGQGPRGFQWLRPGVLAGMAAPGLTNDISYDLDLIRHTGVTCLVTLTTEPLASESLREHGLQSVFFPIEDMDCPTEESAAELGMRVAALLAQGQVIGFHCKAGLGRTGTMLAAQLVFEGLDPHSALQRVRAIEPNWVQSEKQVKFLSRYSQWLRKRQPAGVRTAHKQAQG